MNKILTIGRDAQCDICLPDDTDITSRQHAILEVGRNGRYFITDNSRNGTYVNGIRIASGERTAVCRNDSVSFAHISDLDWNLVPVDRTWLRILLISVAAVLVLAGAGVAIFHFTGGKDDSAVKQADISDIGGIVNGSGAADENTVSLDVPDDGVKKDEPETVQPDKKEKADKPAVKKESRKETRHEQAEAEEKIEIINPIY